MKTTKLTFLFLFLFLFSNLQAQEQEQPNKGFILSINPQYVFKNGLRIDIEKIMQNKKGRLVIAPQLYYSNSGDFWSNMYDYDYYDYETKFDTLVGFGLDIYHKIYLRENETEEGFYFGYGLMYNHFKLNYHSYNWQSQTEDGLEYIKYLPVLKNHKINKFGLNFMLGYQYELSHRLYLDVYSGVGFRNAHHSGKVHEFEMFNDSSIGYGYSGPLFIFSLKLGVML